MAQPRHLNKIAGALLQIQLDGLGIDTYRPARRPDRRGDAEDAKRVAQRLLKGGMLVTVVGAAGRHSNWSSIGR